MSERTRETITRGHLIAFLSDGYQRAAIESPQNCRSGGDVIAAAGGDLLTMPGPTKTLLKNLDVPLSRSIAIASMLAWQDVLQAYRRSLIGPFWFTLAMATQIGAIGVIFGVLFGQDLRDYLPYLATGIVAWGFLSSSLSDLSNCLIQSESLIRQIKLPTLVYVARAILKNLLILAHNAIVLPFVFLIFAVPFEWETLFVLPGISLVILNMVWLGELLGLLSLRFRDLPPMVGAILSVGFYASPVMWAPDQIPNQTLQIIIRLNPLYYPLDLIRSPMLGQTPEPSSWIVLFGLLVSGFALQIIVLRRFRSRVAFWT